MSTSDPTRLFATDPPTLRGLMADWGLKPFRAEQVMQWVYGRGVADYAAMSNLSANDRAVLAERLVVAEGRIDAHQRATDGVEKLLIAWPRDAADPAAPPRTECVMIPSDKRRTACISSQVGCPVGCRFCASGLGGLERDLGASQIVEQVWRLSHLGGGRISHVVFMGMGEPLANFEAVIGAVRTLNADWGLGVSARRITISTVGLPAQIRRLARTDLPVTLAISLHAPNDALRRELIPWAQQVSIDQLLEAGRDYFTQTGREVTLEYTLLRGVNDRPAHAHELAGIAATLRANVNLIRYNPVASLRFDRPSGDDVLAFQQILRRAGVNTHIRASRGQDIAAACGQLRHEASSAGP